jgi:glutamate-1-semialdehyde 2,1-aminomutase
VTACLPSGTAFPAPHPAQLRLAGMITGRYPAVQQVRFTNSGTEASLLALRVARSATGRRRIVTFTGAYHGGVPEIIDGGPDTVPVRDNDADQAVAAIDSSVAAVFVEPLLGSAGVIPAAPGFLSQIAGRARQVGAVFVLDEVQSLRNAPNGTHAALGLEPDLLLMGKIIGGGFPVGAVGGRTALMDLTSAARPGGLSCSGRPRRFPPRGSRHCTWPCCSRASTRRHGAALTCPPRSAMTSWPASRMATREHSAASGTRSP